MKPEVFDLTIAEAKEKKPHFFSGSHMITEEPMQETRLAAIEIQQKIKLPPAYRHYLTTIGCGDLGFVSILSPDPDSKMSLWVEYDYAPSGKGVFLPFAGNGCGDYLCFKIENGECSDSIFWADHETDYAVSPAEYEDFFEYVCREGLGIGA